MAGVKGKSGGARPNSGGARPNSGGKRPGAGRKPKSAAKAPAAPASSVSVALDPQPHGGALKRTTAAPVPQPESTDMLTLLQNVALGLTDASALQVRAAIAAVQYTHTKRGDGGKKDEAQEKAEKAATGSFRPKAPPRLVASNG